MDGLISLLLFAGVFFLMMRFGCGAHMVHGGHGKHGQKGGTDVKHVDPVCGMQVSQREGYGMVHDGRLHSLVLPLVPGGVRKEPGKIRQVTVQPFSG